MSRRARASGLLLLAIGGALRAQEASGLGEAPDPFAAPPPAGLGTAPDPFAPGDAAAGDAAPVESARPAGEVAAVSSGFDPGAVDLAHEVPGFELHGRANLTGALSNGHDQVELLEDNSLELSSIDLYAQWIPLTWLGVLAEIELETELEDGDRAVEVDLELGVIELRPLGTDRLRLRGGWFPAPFGLERRYYSPPRNELATRPAPFLRLFPGDYSDLGVMLWWRQPLAPWGAELELELALVRGLEDPRRGEDPARSLAVEGRPEAFQGDRNHEPQFVGRVGLTVLDLDPDRKGDHRWAQLLPTSLKLTLGTSGLLGNWDDRARRRVSYVGYDAQLELGGWRLRFEAVLARVEGMGQYGRDQRGGGLYTLIAYHWRPGLLLVEELIAAFRYELLDPDRSVDDTLDIERYHWGLGWSPVRGLLLKAGWELTAPRHGNDSRSVVYLEAGYSF